MKPPLPPSMVDNNRRMAEDSMLRDLTIQNYRSFNSFQIDGLARVNLVVGMNNSGKTSLLEAVYLLVNQGNPQCLVGLLEDRGEIVPFTRSIRASNVVGGTRYQIRHIFHDHQFVLDKTIQLQSQKEHFLSLQIQLSPITRQAQLFEDVPETDIPIFELSFSYSSDVQMRVPVRDDGTIEARSFRLTKQSQPNLFSSTPACNFLTTNNLSFEELAGLWDGITLTPKEEEVVRALQILKPSVERISFTSRQTSNSGILLKLHGQREPIPLGSMGDGMRRILTLAMAEVTVENGFLLVDEIDTGLHYQAQTDMWHLVLEVAQKLNVQVFATTHSWDCISAFQEALQQSEDSSVGKLFRLSLRGENTHAVEYTPDELSIAVRQSIEVR